MKNKNLSNDIKSSDKDKKINEQDYISVFKYFEDANIRNREAFCELLDYTMENKKEP